MKLSKTAYIGIGSNLGDRLKNCRAAIRLLDEHDGIDVIKISKWYESKAQSADGEYIVDDPPFINGAVEIRTDLTPEQLLSKLQQTEESFGRPRCRRKGAPRTLDLDLLLFEDKIINTPDLMIPHPSLHKRLFVLAPLCDIAPDVEIAPSGLTAKELLNRCFASQS